MSTHQRKKNKKRSYEEQHPDEPIDQTIASEAVEKRKRGFDDNDGSDSVNKISDAAPRTANLTPRKVNSAGKPADAGIIDRVYVENFMCHRKLTVTLCQNVNFIHGQNGSGKSAVLAAIQICLGAGARRTHRARNLRELIRKGSSPGTCARVRVTLLNKGSDAFQHEVYGDHITVERSIASSSGGYNGYKLLNTEMKEKSRSKKDLDLMLDQLNIQVENPVAVLDQEEAKKFLTGKAEDKYAFFMKATELERIDRSYASTQDTVYELEETNNRIRDSLKPASDNVKKLEKEWENCQELEKLEGSIGDQRILYAWSFVKELQKNVQKEEKILNMLNAKLAQRSEEFEQFKDINSGAQEEHIKSLNDKMALLTEEAQQARSNKLDMAENVRKAMAPVKKTERELKDCKRDGVLAKRRIVAATNRLKNARDEILKNAGNAESEEARRTEMMEQTESSISEDKVKLEKQKTSVAQCLNDYDELEPHVDQAKSNVNAVNVQMHAVLKRGNELKSTAGSRSLAVFGPKCATMAKKVEEARKSGRFRGPVAGPIGSFIKVAPGKEHLAKLAEKALGNGMLDRFVVTTDSDRKLYMKLRQDAGCSSRDCGVFQQANVPRYRNIPPPPCDGVETAVTVLSVSDDLVFNCLVDNSRIDQTALCESREHSEEKLLIRNENTRKDAVRGGKITKVFFLPKGDFWQVKNGLRSLVSNEAKLKQIIGVDRTAAIREAEHEATALKKEADELKKKLSDVQREHKDMKRKWNEESKSIRKIASNLETLQSTLERLKEEAISSEEVTIDTTDLEEDVKNAQDSLEVEKRKEYELSESIEALKPELIQAQRDHQEILSRNEKVIEDMASVEKEIEGNIKEAAKRQKNLENKEAKLSKLEEGVDQQSEVLKERNTKVEESLYKARVTTYKLNEAHDEGGSIELSDEKLAAVKPVETTDTPDTYKKKVQKMQKKIEQERKKRELTDSDPVVIFEKYQRAKNDIASKLNAIKKVKANVEVLIADLRDRKNRWKIFRKHIGRLTNDTFDEILNKKGSCGEIEFDHQTTRLNIVVQKDNTNDMSQTKDVKALSGGERSFTTLSLLLALGENLETPFRVMDEFDVFLDPISRKIALDTMVEIAKQMEHRQFIFITPQDVSSLTPDPKKLKIIKMKPPSREQQTLEEVGLVSPVSK